ncbi:MAG: metallophosphoesterase family protein [Syntrophomonadaceae bacterium]|jgi:exonuclease SbcD
MRFLFLTDTHIRGSNPQNRTDNLPESLRDKLVEVMEIASRYQVDYILHGGDFFDTPSPSLAVTADFLALFSACRIPVYTIPGNHDLFGANQNSLPRTLLGFLARLGFIKLLEAGRPVYLDKHNCRVQISGQPYHYDMDRRDPELDYTIKKNGADMAIHLVHGMLVNEKSFPGDQTQIDQILDTQAEITLCGHNHLGFGIIEKNGKSFINPGALVRLSNHRSEITRPVQVVLINLDGNQIESTLLPLKTARPGQEVLDRSKVEERNALQMKIDMFAQEIKQVANMEQMNVKNIIDEVVQSLGESPQIRQEALDRIARVEESLRYKGGQY